MKFVRMCLVLLLTGNSQRVLCALEYMRATPQDTCLVVDPVMSMLSLYSCFGGGESESLTRLYVKCVGEGGGSGIPSGVRTDSGRGVVFCRRIVQYLFCAAFEITRHPHPVRRVPHSTACALRSREAKYHADE